MHVYQQQANSTEIVSTNHHDTGSDISLCQLEILLESLHLQVSSYEQQIILRRIRHDFVGVQTVLNHRCWLRCLCYKVNIEAVLKVLLQALLTFENITCMSSRHK